MGSGLLHWAVKTGMDVSWFEKKNNGSDYGQPPAKILQHSLQEIVINLLI